MNLFSRHRRREPLILRPLPERKRSLAAGWAVRLAVFAPILAVVSIIAHGVSIVDTPTFLILLASVVAIAALAFVLIFVALSSLWSKGTRGGRQAILALFLSVLTLGPCTAAAIEWVANPRQNDVSTDLVDPPLLGSEMRVSDADPAAVVAARLRNGYPHLTGRRFKAPPDAIEETILSVAESHGWTLVSRRGRIGADDELFYEFSYRVPVLGIPGSVIIRMVDEGDTSYVDMRARTQFVPHDLGWNARLIENYLKTLDFELIGIVEL